MRKKTIMMHIVKIQISKVIDCQGFIISLSWVLKIVRIKFFESLMFVPHGGGGLVSIQFSSLVTNTATDPRPRALTRFYLPWSMTAALLVLFSSDYLAFFFENLRELLVTNWWCYNQDRRCAQCPVQLKSKVSILLNEGLAVTKLSHVWSWRHPDSEWLIYTWYTFRGLLFLDPLGAQEVTMCAHSSIPKWKNFRVQDW